MTEKLLPWQMEELIDGLQQQLAAIQAENEALRRQLAEKDAEIERLEADKDDAEHGPWEEWAEQVLKIVRKHTGYDGFDDADGVDLPNEVAEALSEYEAQIARVESQLSESQAREVKLREALRLFYSAWASGCQSVAVSAISVAKQENPADNTALREMIAKAGEVMRERCAKHCDEAESQYFDGCEFRNVLPSDLCEEIRALPGVTLEDLRNE